MHGYRAAKIEQEVGGDLANRSI